MNNKDLLYIKREFDAWGWWVYEGCVIPSALSFKCSWKVETGSETGLRVPERIKLDRNVQILHRMVAKQPQEAAEALIWVHPHHRPERQLSAVTGRSRHQIRKILYKAYEIGLEAIS